MKNMTHILLIEDDEDDQYFFVTALKKIKDAMLQKISENGKDAIGYLNTTALLPDLIFMDINMPGMNGLECLTLLKGNPVTREIPVVMLSTSTEQRALALRLGAYDFIRKPWEGGLVPCIEAVLHSGVFHA